MPTSNPPLRYSLKKLDHRMPGFPRYLAEDDRCYYLGDYIVGGVGRPHEKSELNSIIYNLKMPLSERGKSRFFYKGQAIRQCAELIASAVDLDQVKQITWVPMPSSTARTNADYDDRLLQVLKLIGRNRTFDVRELLVRDRTVEARHSNPGLYNLPQRHIDSMRVDVDPFDDTPKWIMVFDDVISDGCHFRAAHQMLSAEFPDAQIDGLFLGKRTLAADEPPVPF